MALNDLRQLSSTCIFLWTMFSIVLQRSVAQNGNTMNDQSLDASYFFYQQSEYPRDCQEVLDQCSSRNSSGIYYIKPDGYQDPFQVYCDLTGDLEGWTVINRRAASGIVRFDRDWDSYQRGFGFPSQEYWIGNERLAYLTNQKEYALRIQMTFEDGLRYVVTFNSFRISDEFSGYSLSGLTWHSSTGDHLVSWCPSNMVYGNCSCGQRLCGDPLTCVDTCAEDRVEGCVCPDGYFMEGDECVPRGECGCYVSEEQILVPEGRTYINSGCSMKATCSNGQLTMNQAYECDSNAECDEREDGRRCYCNDGYEGNGERCTSTTPSVDCMDVFNRGSTVSGVYSIKPTNWAGSPFNVSCNMTNGGGWTVLQRRVDGSEDFFLGWDDYRRGFGDETGEHWLGNNKIHSLTNQKRYKVRIDVVNRDNDPYYAEFDFFRIGNEDTEYTLSGLGTYSGTADERSTPNGYYILGRGRDRAFSTKDNDNDGDSISLNIAANYYTAWWYYYYGGAYYSINGRYSDYFQLAYLPGTNYLYFSEMKIRPV